MTNMRDVMDEEEEEYAARVARELDAALSEAPTFASLTQTAPSPALDATTDVRPPPPPLPEQMAEITADMPDFTAPPQRTPAAMAPASLDGARYGGPAPGTAGWDAIATPEQNRPAMAPEYGTGKVKPMSSQDIAAHMASLGLKGAAPVLPSDRVAPVSMPASYADALKMDPASRSRALESLRRLSPEERQALQMLPGAPMGPKPLDPLTAARVEAERAKAGMYGSRGGLYEAQADKLARLRRGGGGGGVPAGAADQYGAESVLGVIGETYERAGLQPPAGLLTRAQNLDAVPRKSRSKAADVILREMDADIRKQKPGAAGQMSATAEKKQLMLSEEETALQSLKAELEKRDPSERLPASTGTLGSLARSAEQSIVGTSGLSDEDQSLETALTQAGFTNYITTAQNAPNSDAERELASRKYRGSGRVSGALLEVNKRLAEIQKSRSGGNQASAQAAPAASGGVRIRDPKSGRTGTYKGTAEQARAAGYEVVGG